MNQIALLAFYLVVVATTFQVAHRQFAKGERA
jgi:hypothetical protein